MHQRRAPRQCSAQLGATAAAAPLLRHPQPRCSQSFGALARPVRPSSRLLARDSILSGCCTMPRMRGRWSPMPPACRICSTFTSLRMLMVPFLTAKPACGEWVATEQHTTQALWRGGSMHAAQALRHVQGAERLPGGSVHRQLCGRLHHRATCFPGWGRSVLRGRPAARAACPQLAAPTGCLPPAAALPRGSAAAPTFLSYVVSAQDAQEAAGAQVGAAVIA